MATQNQGLSIPLQTELSYDDANFGVRQSAYLTINQGAFQVSAKFVAYQALQLYALSLFTTVQGGTSTYTVAGTATTNAQSFTLYYAYNVSSTAIALATQTMGPFIIGGLSTYGRNVNVPGLAGGAAGGWASYAINTLGGTNTTMPWGTQTLSAATVADAHAGWGGVPVNQGDQIYVVSGTDASWSGQIALEFTLGPSALLIA